MSTSALLVEHAKIDRLGYVIDDNVVPNNDKHFKKERKKKISQTEKWIKTWKKIEKKLVICCNFSNLTEKKISFQGYPRSIQSRNMEIIFWLQRKITRDEGRISTITWRIRDDRYNTTD